MVIMPTTKNNPPEILVIIPTLGERLEYLQLALESIKNQAPIRFDIMVVLPLKNKTAVALAKKYGAIIVDDPGGMSAALNLGIANTKPHHKYIVWMGDDDILQPESLKTTYEALSNNPQATVAFGYCDYIDSNGAYLFSSRAGSLAPWLMTWGPDLVPMMGLMFRKSAFEKAGGFDASLKYAMDLDLLLRLRKLGPFINTRRTISNFRWHTTSQTVSNRPKVLVETEIIKHKYLPAYLKPISVLWEWPVRVATKIAVKKVNMKAKRLAS